MTARAGDFDGDGRADFVVFRPGEGMWYVIASSSGQGQSTRWGEPGDVPVPADYDGDGKLDIAIWRPSSGTWWLIDSATGSQHTHGWGQAGDIPVPADWSGDGHADAAIWRPDPGEWWLPTGTVRWGEPGDIPVVADFDGDGRPDIAIWRPSTGEWWIIDSASGNQHTHQWGQAGDIPVPADYDGDGRADLAVWRPANGIWYVIPSSSGQAQTQQWGQAGDIPVPADYDGDGRTDYAVWRPGDGTWYVIPTSTGQARTQQWGTTGDIPAITAPTPSSTAAPVVPAPGRVHVGPGDVTLGGDYWQAGYDIDTGGPAPVWGLADVHAHPVSHLAFGGRLLWGRPDGAIQEALRWCTDGHGPGGTGLASGLGIIGALTVSFIEGGPGHLVGGYPEFDGWPRFTSMIHQKMYVEWVRRAWQGGLRLMVALVVNNEALAFAAREPVGAAISGSVPSDDRSAVDLQISEMQALVARHPDFMEIARTPSEARRIIGEGRLAVVLGVEVDSLGKWGREGDATDDDVRGYLRELYDRGVRHVFPIHLANNAFGGTAVFSDEFNGLNAFLRGEFLSVQGSDRTTFRLLTFPSWLRSALPGLTVYPDYAAIPGGHVNALGLTARGTAAVAEMMRLGMVIDVDHMSAAAVSDTLVLAEAREYPLCAGHAAFSALANTRNEYQRTPEQVDRIRALGGIIAVGLHQSDLAAHGTTVPNDAPGSSKSWAQAYLWLTERMRGAGVAIGTDINGLAGQAAPRFGLNACYELEQGDEPGQRDARRAAVYAQGNGVRYTREVVDYRAYRFEGRWERDVFNQEERDVWESIAIFKSGTDPDQAEMPGPFRRTIWQNGKIKNMAKGFRATSEDQLENPLFGGQTYNEQRAAFLVAQGRDPDPSEEDERKRLHGVIRGIWERWHAMYGDNVPLVRNLAGRRDFDINIDGVAHYGLLPDFLQDLRNVGLSQAQLAPLFRSAEDYLRTWERCERLRERPARNAQFVRDVVPGGVRQREQFTATAVMRNTGSLTWTAGEGFRLGTDNGDWGAQRWELPAPVAPGQDVAIAVSLTAPSAPGQHEIHWRMLQEGVEWFGDVTPTRQIAVLEDPRCESLRATIDAEQAEIETLQGDLQGAATSERPRIRRKIAEAQQRLDAAKMQAEQLGCAP